jgi:hypothetical protein
MHSPSFEPKSPFSRSPKRITITVPHATFQAIVQRSGVEGRSMSNLAATILEQELKAKGY